ncbi:unnamed protein product [Camellia sinensis]
MACTQEEVNKAMEIAKTAQKLWAKTLLWKRAELLHKMLVDDIGDATITNDGAIILKMLDVEHPAAKVEEQSIHLAELQDREAGNGTTTVALVNLTSLERSYVEAMDNLIEIWPGELQAKLRRMIVQMCHGLPNILFPSNLMKAMQSLETLEVQHCQSVEVAFGIEGLIVRDGHQNILFPSLIDVSLGYLPKLTHVWKDNLSGIQGFENLTSLNIKG